MNLRFGTRLTALAVALALVCFVARAGGDKWLSLFDGKTLDGWERKAVHGGNGGLWDVEKGLLVGNQEADHKGGLLGTTKTYGDYEIELDFQADDPLDSGLFLRTTPQGNAYQITIDYRTGGSVGDIYVPYSGGFVAQDKGWLAKYKKDKWNHLKARIVGQPPHIEVWLNQKKTVDFTDTKERMPREGYVGLQVHGGGGSWGDKSRIRYRNIRLRSLEASK